MPILSTAPNNFRVDNYLRLALSNLGHTNVNDPDSTNNDEKAIRNLMYSLGFSKWDEAYRGLILKVSTLGADAVNSKHKVRAVIDTLTLSAYYSTFTEEPVDDDPTEQELKTNLYDFIKGDERSKSSGSYKVGMLDEFSGQDSEWLIWKERAIARFKIDGLYETLTDQIKSQLNKKENTIIHGMLTQALLKNDKSASFTCLMDNRDDGYKAWKSLCEYYEHKELIKNILKELSDKIHCMQLTDVNEWNTFVANFMTTRNRIVVFLEKARDLGISDVTLYSVPDWKLYFLERINVAMLQSRVESCRYKDSTLWETILSLKGFILEKNAMPNKRKTGQNKRKERNDVARPKEDNEGMEPSPAAKPKPLNPFQKVYDALNCEQDQELAKKMRAILAKAKEANQEGNKRPRYRKKQRRTPHSRRMTSFGDNEVDEEALEIIGGDSD